MALLSGGLRTSPIFTERSRGLHAGTHESQQEGFVERELKISELWRDPTLNWGSSQDTAVSMAIS